MTEAPLDHREESIYGLLGPERLEFQGDLTGDGVIVCPDSTRHQKTLDDRDNSWNQCPAEDRVEHAEADLAHVEMVNMPATARPPR